jgi:hypothetical protein
LGAPKRNPRYRDEVAGVERLSQQKTISSPFNNLLRTSCYKDGRNVPSFADRSHRIDPIAGVQLDIRGDQIGAPALGRTHRLVTGSR